jgi:cytidylate kinase
MNDIFSDYLSKRFSEMNLDKLKRQPGPIITISRIAGCSAQQIAKLLAEKLNNRNLGNNWEVISKEILHASAEKLRLHPDKIQTIFVAKHHNFFDELAKTFLSSDYNLEYKMRKTVVNVIHRFAVDGHKIIIGRASNIICSDIKNSLHIRIEAPVEWQIKKIMQAQNVTRAEALDFIKVTDDNRASFRKLIKGENTKNDNFDLTINHETYTDEEIVEIIMHAAELKKMTK